MTKLSDAEAAGYLRETEIPVNRVTLAACKAGILGEMKASGKLDYESTPDDNDNFCLKD